MIHTKELIELKRFFFKKKKIKTGKSKNKNAKKSLFPFLHETNYHPSSLFLRDRSLRSGAGYGKEERWLHMYSKTTKREKVIVLEADHFTLEEEGGIDK